MAGEEEVDSVLFNGKLIKWAHAACECVCSLNVKGCNVCTHE